MVKIPHLTVQHCTNQISSSNTHVALRSFLHTFSAHPVTSSFSLLPMIRATHPFRYLLAVSPSIFASTHIITLLPKIMRNSRVNVRSSLKVFLQTCSTLFTNWCCHQMRTRCYLGFPTALVSQRSRIFEVANPRKGALASPGGATSLLKTESITVKEQSTKSESPF